MIEENLVLTSTTIRQISIYHFINEMNKLNWNNIEIETSIMPRKDLKSPITKKLNYIPKKIRKFIDTFETRVESMSISGTIDGCQINLTVLIDKNQVKWIEINFKAEKKANLESNLKKFNSFLRKDKS
ncbi:MAG: hypothetical protein GF329_07890 [Candidatus Lokiarchaeota archaeon]|nr:hypothetical protein [Candidatus Lokiarchaeota archaeon]